MASCYEMLGKRMVETEHWASQLEMDQKYRELLVVENQLQIMRALRLLLNAKIGIED